MIDLSRSAEQDDIAASAYKFLTEEMPISRVRELAADHAGDSIDDRTWQRCASLGWLSLSLSEENGGVGLGLREEVMLFREFGRFLTPGPFRSSVLGLRVAAGSGYQELSGAIANGERRVGMVVGEFGVDVRTDDLILEIDRAGGALFDVSSVRPVQSVDPMTRLGRVERGTLVARLHDPMLISRARVLAAAELLGIIEAVRDMSASYARSRVQFGQPIGSFQAVKHRCADMSVAAYATTAQLHFAASRVNDDAPDAAFHAAAAYVLACKGASSSVADNVQNHGGIGFTWELDAHLYLKRAFLLEHLLGSSRESYGALLEPAGHPW